MYVDQLNPMQGSRTRLHIYGWANKLRQFRLQLIYLFLIDFILYQTMIISSDDIIIFSFGNSCLIVIIVDFECDSISILSCFEMFILRVIYVPLGISVADFFNCLLIQKCARIDPSVLYIPFICL